MLKLEFIRFAKKKWLWFLLIAFLAADILLMWLTIEDYEKPRWWIRESEEYIYSDYLDSIIDNCYQLLESKELGELTEYRKNSVNHMLGKYLKLKDITVSYDVTEGIELSTGMDWQLFFQLSLICIISSAIFLTERNCQELEKSLKNGRRKLMFIRLSLVWLLTAFGTIIFYVSNIAITAQSIGMGDLKAPIQSLEAFRLCPYKINGCEYLILLLLARIMAGCVFATFFSFFICVFDSIFIGMIINILLSVTSFYAFSLITDASKAVYFRYASPWAFLDGKIMFQNYTCLKFCNKAMPFTYLIVSSGVIFLLVGTLLTVFTGHLRVNCSFKGLLGKKKDFRKNSTISENEFFKLMIENKGIVILLVGVLFITFFNLKNSFWIDENERYYRNYMLIYEGEITEDKESEINIEIERLSQAEEELEKLNERYYAGEIDSFGYEFEAELISKQIIMREALQKVIKSIDSVKKHQGTMLAYETGINSFLFENSTTKNFHFLFGGFMIVLFCGGIFSLEKERGTYDLLYSAKNGRKKTNRYKITLGLLMALFITTSTNLVEIIRIACTYRIPKLFWSVGNGFEKEWLYKLPIIIILAFAFLIRIILSQGLALVTMLISAKSGRTNYAVIAGFLVVISAFVVRLSGLEIFGLVV